MSERAAMAARAAYPQKGDDATMQEWLAQGIRTMCFREGYEKAEEDMMAWLEERMESAQDQGGMSYEFYRSAIRDVIYHLKEG